MRDVPKNVGQDDAHGVHGRTHTQAELRESRPLLLGGLRLLIALVVSVLYGTFDTYSPNKDTSSVWIAGILSSVAALFVLAVVFTSPRNPDHLLENLRAAGLHLSPGQVARLTDSPAPPSR